MSYLWRIKSTIDFYKDKSNTDGLSRKCKACHDIKTLAAKSRNKEHNQISGSATIGTRVCNDCKKQLPIIDFAKDINRLKGRAYVCRECKNAKSKENNPATKRGSYKKRKPSEKVGTKISAVKKCKIEKCNNEAMINGWCNPCYNKETARRAKEKRLAKTTIKKGNNMEKFGLDYLQKKINELSEQKETINKQIEALQITAEIFGIKKIESDLTKK